MLCFFLLSIALSGVKAEPEITHRLNTLHHDIRTATQWEAGLTFPGLAVNDALSSPDTGESKDTAKQQTHLTLYLISLE